MTDVAKIDKTNLQEISKFSLVGVSAIRGFLRTGVTEAYMELFNV